MIHQLLEALARRISAHFASFTYTTKETGEVAKYHLILGATTETLYAKDIVKLNRILPLLQKIGAQPHVILAAQELLNSRNESLTKGIGNNSAYTNKDTYTNVDGFPGVRMHNETGALYVSGLLNHKIVIQEGTPRKPVKSAPKTIAKRRIEKLLPSGRYRMFTLTNVSRAAVNGNVLELA